MSHQRRLRFWPRRRVPVVLQGESAECALACLAMVAAYHGGGVGMQELRSRFGVSLRGATLDRMVSMAAALGLAARPVSLELSEVAALRLPCVLHWKFNHFVVLERVGQGRLDIVDPLAGRRRVASASVRKNFTGVALELVPTGRFDPKPAKPALRLRSFVGTNPGLTGGLLRILGLSLVLQLFTLAAPYYSQLVLDEVLTSGDRQLLVVLAAAFAGLALCRVLVQLLRAWVILILGTRLRFSWIVALFHHLLRLPLQFFQARHVGDILSRFGSVTAVQNLVTTAAVEALVDGVLALATLTLMLVYSPTLSLLVLLALLAQILIRLAFFPAQRRAQQEALALNAREQSHFAETLRAAQTLKCMAAEGRRSRHWQNAVTDALNQGLKISALGLAEGSLGQFLAAAESIALLYVGSLSVLDGSFTVGMLVAFLAWRGLFTGGATGLLDRWLQFRLVGLHLERLSDIVLAEPEPAPYRPAPQPLAGSIELHELSYAHARGEPALLRAVNLHIGAGECVAITGPSGCGKSTLLRLMLGLLAPATGKVMVDGIELAQLNPHSYREQVAAVLQDDTLLAGTLRDNIAGFASTVDEAGVLTSARLAQIHDEITSMPMGYLSLVGDMGSCLSGGQLQRVLLARALYRQPRILFLDEASSHLDPQSERRVNAMLAVLPITRVVVAHGREVLQLADKVIDLSRFTDQLCAHSTRQ